MKILKIRVRFNLEYMNSPDIEVLVDKIPCHSELRYREKGNSYLACKDGYVNFFVNPKSGGGLGETITMKDGTVKNCEGAWSSNSGYMQQVFNFSCAEVSITDDPGVWRSRRTFYRGAMSCKILQRALNNPKVSEVKEGHIYMVQDIVGCWCPSLSIEGVQKPGQRVEKKKLV